MLCTVCMGLWYVTLILPFVVSDLGIEIYSSLKYDAHINNIVGKAYCRIGVLFKAFTTRHVPVLKKAFLTYVRPVLEYASNVWAFLFRVSNAFYLT